jgi:hypothetical protein
LRAYLFSRSLCTSYGQFARYLLPFPSSSSLLLPTSSSLHLCKVPPPSSFLLPPSSCSLLLYPPSFLPTHYTFPFSLLPPSPSPLSSLPSSLLSVLH